MLKNNPKKIEEPIKDHYNIHLYNKALKLINSDPYYAKELFEDYIKEYPNDYLALSIYISLLITLKEYKYASDLLAFLDKKIENDDEDFILQHTDKKHIDFSRIRLMSFQGQYKKLYEFLTDNKDLFECYDLDEVYLLCKKKLGICCENKDEYNYLARQIIKYEKSDMLHRVGYHTANYNLTKDEPYENIFVPDFPLEKIISEIEKHVPADNSICPGLIADTYYFKYDNCGKENDKSVDFIKVACFHNTGDIITICPVKVGEKLDYVDLNYLKESTDSKKIKQISRIERFNKRYNLK